MVAETVMITPGSCTRARPRGVAGISFTSRTIVLELLAGCEGAVSVIALTAVVVLTQGAVRWVAAMLAIGALAILVGVGAAMTSSGASLSRDEWIAGQARRVTHDWRRPQSPGITGHGSLFRHSVEWVHEKVMMRALSIIGGSVFILLALPKAAGLFHALAVGSPTPTQFIVKQAVYTIALIGAGVATFRAGRR
jgi:hypothetical protein